ncbi:MAG: single-stranded DNA-binding protein [Candidatus Margulisbacteria bacterium]|nr:single-stranded DNA-binding protein [Candidatus Margulisiibacteriota bacterium]MBU1022298.1 single-stranded DNA-binding protein [Candidatus Margulisiibacteriota bacterium]MBU1729911.1 single-stranded DNA-binding protein [Candidatus Margulisiibacteriota bacterium]MBU1955944.1 single-stranded DNA-binding protein [Candidatus Margulisiibacteriota bacterium]
MTSINRIVLTGRLTRDPETKTVADNIQVSTFSLAVDRFKKKGEKEVSFVNCVAWRGFSKLCSLYLKKGRLIAVEGRLQVRKYEAKDGGSRTATEVVVSNIQLLDNKFSKAANKAVEKEEVEEEVILV